MSYRLPVIVSDIPANLEVKLNDEHYFQTGNVEQLTEKLKESVARDFQRIDYPMEEYDWDVIAEKTMEVYKSIE